MPDTSTAPRIQTAAAVRRLPWSALSVLVLAGALAFLVFTYDRPADTLSELGSVIRCPVCQGVPIADSPSPMAQDMMELLRSSLADGASREDAVAELLGAYPGSLLLEPAVSASTLALWLVPLAAALAGIGLTLSIRRGSAVPEAGLERSELALRLEQVEADLSDLARQEAAGEVDGEAAGHLRVAYQSEKAETVAALAAAPETPLRPPRSPRRAAWGAAILVTSLVAVVAVAGAFLVDRPDATSGVAGLAGDPADYSNETLAAVIAANQDHPQINGMRLALAERYFDEGDFPSAFPYYFDVARSEQATDAQAASALTRLGMMTYFGNGEAETALDLLAEARRLAPNDPFPHYLEAVVTWCGLGDLAAAESAFTDVLASSDLEDDTRREVEAALAAVEEGEACPS